MKKCTYFIYAVFFFFPLYYSFLKAAESSSTDFCVSSRTSSYLDSKAEVTQPILKLLKITGIKLSSSQLEKVVSATQGQSDPSLSWIGTPTKERWEKDSKKITLSLAQAKKIINICSNDLGQGKAVHLQTSHPKGILFLGSTLSSVRKRLAYLNTLYSKGTLSLSRPVYILTGERKLDATIGETSFELINPSNGIISFRKDWVPSDKIASDEGEMIELVFAQSRHEKLKKENIHLVYSPKGEGRRATTESTVKQWLQDFSPKGGTYIAISNAPYIFCQECVIRRVLLQLGRNDICVRVVGSAMEVKKEDESEILKKAQNFLNNTARTLNELLEIKKWKLSEPRH